jgi:protein phosphatase
VRESPSAGLLVVADGVSGQAAGAVASRTAVDAAVRVYQEQADLRPDRRVARAVQDANIAVYDLAVVVPELRGMATTMTALAVDAGRVTAAHVGDCRLFLIRQDRIVQLSKDHTVVAERVRMGLLGEARARHHPDRSVLTRSLGRELIVAVDRITTPARQGDVLIVCSDGLYNVLDDSEIRRIAAGRDADSACRALIDAANARGTPDNLTAAVLQLTGPIPTRPDGGGFGTRLRRLIGRDR